MDKLNASLIKLILFNRLYDLVFRETVIINTQDTKQEKGYMDAEIVVYQWSYN